MTQSARVAAQAKVNLLLHILGREVSGFHSIETVFLRLELADAVTVRVADGRSIDCDGPSLPPTGLGRAEDNLAFRAAAAYAGATGWPKGFAIELTKRIPVGGGLGGGSADAGAVLRALDAMSPVPLGPRLPALAASLGSDVAFMATDTPMALAWGRGERLLALPGLEPRPALLVTPDFAIATAEAYGWLSSDREQFTPTGAVLTASSLATWAGMATVATNDFEPVVSRRRPVIAHAVHALRSEGALIAMLSGSGSVVFGIFNGKPDAAGVHTPGGCSTLCTRTSDRVVRVELDQ